MPKIGIIAGSGFPDLDGVSAKDFRRLTTPYGEPSDIFKICESDGIEFAFLSRHGTPHHISPQMINYRANIWGFKELGAERILSINAVGAINQNLKPGVLVVPDQIIDMTNGRASTFYDGDEVVHVDFTLPFCSEIREAILKRGKSDGDLIQNTGTYICVNGPRLESKAEIEYFSKIGGDIVGMTVMPEAVLSREAGICFAAVAAVSNYAAGISGRKLTAVEVVEAMRASTERIGSLLMETLKTIPENRRCDCKDALKDAKM